MGTSFGPKARAMKLAVSFTNLGPYHLARLRALAAALAARGDELVVYETAGSERRYPWLRAASEAESFGCVTLFPDRALESLPRLACRRAVVEALDRDRPDALGVVGYARPESMAMAGWARRNGRPTVLMSESQEIDHPRAWWKEAIKRRRVAGFSAGLVGGPRHAEYLVTLGMSADRIAFGYDVVDNDRFGHLADAARSLPEGRMGLPQRPYFLAVSRFVPEKNLARLVAAFASYRSTTGEDVWDLVLCGGGPGEAEVDAAIRASGVASSIHRPGFLQVDELSRWMAHASGFVHPSLMEPWGLVANEAAACGLPLLVSDRAGCAETLVPDPSGTTGRRFDPTSTGEMTAALAWLAGLPEPERRAMGGRAEEIVSGWGPERFASGMIEALSLAIDHERRKTRRTSRNETRVVSAR
jgi:glycosyltransferase involved in cell wall biosynthesis